MPSHGYTLSVTLISTVTYMNTPLSALKGQRRVRTERTNPQPNTPKEHKLTLTIDRTELALADGTRLTLVSEHQRALPGEGGSDYKPVNVSEHLRCIGEDGNEHRYATAWKWEDGQLSPELFEAMAKVVGITNYPKSFKWTLKTATYVLSHGMRYHKKSRQWYRVGRPGNPSTTCESRSVAQTMTLIDSVERFWESRGYKF